LWKGFLLKIPPSRLKYLLGRISKPRDRKDFSIAGVAIEVKIMKDIEFAERLLESRSARTVVIRKTLSKSNPKW